MCVCVSSVCVMCVQTCVGRSEFTSFLAFSHFQFCNDIKNWRWRRAGNKGICRMSMCA